MKLRFYILAIFAGILTIVALPVGIVFFIFLAIYYCTSTYTKEPSADTVHYNFREAFNSEEYKKIQEDMK